MHARCQCSGGGAADDPVKEVEAAEQIKSLGSWSHCPSGWSRYGSRCFAFFSSPKNWLQAEDYCLHFGANLASIHSSAEYHYIQELVLSRTGELTPAWIGASDAVQENMWLWSDGSRFDFQHWAWGEPSNFEGGEACIEMNYIVDKLWNDLTCGYQLPFICAKRLNC
ncbi:ladderlectin-like [Myripristis murdjan]|uniref:ladderlectin-like n=1 Tax=Myripristis murdjan TaxID=586833 RepID=UPI001175F3D4|nr:ladderlectin-like [Myripristis murdjan]